VLNNLLFTTIKSKLYASYTPPSFAHMTHSAHVVTHALNAEPVCRLSQLIINEINSHVCRGPDKLPEAGANREISRFLGAVAGQSTPWSGRALKFPPAGPNGARPPNPLYNFVGLSALPDSLKLVSKSCILWGQPQIWKE